MDLSTLAGHAWQWNWRHYPARPLHLASCPCWTNDGAPAPRLIEATRRPPSSLWARLFGAAQA